MQRARFWSCRKFWPSFLTGDTRISCSVAVMSESFILKSAIRSRHRRKIAKLFTKNCEQDTPGKSFYSQVIRLAKTHLERVECRQRRARVKQIAMQNRSC